MRRAIIAVAIAAAFSPSSTSAEEQWRAFGVRNCRLVWQESEDGKTWTEFSYELPREGARNTCGAFALWRRADVEANRKREEKKAPTPPRPKVSL